MQDDQEKPPPGPTSLGGADEQHRLLMECVTDYAILMLDNEGRVAAWNAGAERTFGYGEREALGLPFARFFVPEDVAQGKHEQELQTAAANGKAADDKWHVRKDGTRLWVNGVTTALRDERGDLRGFAKVCRDRTEKKQADEALREADRRKDEFLAILAHELRGPLAPIRHAIELLGLRGVPDQDAKWSRDLLERQVQHLTRLVDDLLDVSRITRGKLEMRRTTVDLRTVTRRAVEAVRSFVEERGQTLSVSLSNSPLWLEGDEVRLAQVVTNLLNNAAKYTDQGGRIRLTVEREGDDGFVRVKDSGVGIPAAMLPKIFDLFTQVDDTLTRSQGGLGIGLALVKSLVELHGGSIAAHSDGAGRGSEFTVRVPVQRNEPTPPATVEERRVVALARRILIVDDSRDAAESLAMLLGLSGHEVRTAHDGPAALAAAEAFQPAVVLLDIGLPGGQSGYDLAPRLRQLPGLGDALLVALTGYGQEEDKRRAHEAGFDAHLVKPTDLDVLHALLAEDREKK